MTTHDQRKVRPFPNLEERRAKQEQAKVEPKVNYYQLQKYEALKYNYAAIDEAHRQAVMDLAADIIKWHRRTREELFRFGQRLLEVKEILPHGQFQKWMDAEFQSSQNTLRNMMKVVRVFGGGQNYNVVVLSDSALYLLSGPSVTDEARFAAIKEAEEKGRSPSRVRISQIIQGSGQIEPVAPPDGQDGEPRIFGVVSKRAVCTILFSGDMPDKGNFVVYALIDPRNEQVYYVGATDNFERRMREHCTDGPALLLRRKQEIRDDGCHSVARILTRAHDFDDCRELEREYIGRYYATLVNAGNPEPSAPPQLPAPDPEPDSIEAEYTVIAAPMTFDEWLAAKPADLDLREQLAILSLAKKIALRALGDRPKLYNSVYGALPTWSGLIREMEKMVNDAKHPD